MIYPRVAFTGKVVAHIGGRHDVNHFPFFPASPSGTPGYPEGPVLDRAVMDLGLAAAVIGDRGAKAPSRNAPDANPTMYPPVPPEKRACIDDQDTGCVKEVTDPVDGKPVAIRNKGNSGFIYFKPARNIPPATNTDEENVTALGQALPYFDAGLNCYIGGNDFLDSATGVNFLIDFPDSSTPKLGKFDSVSFFGNSFGGVMALVVTRGAAADVVVGGVGGADGLAMFNTVAGFDDPDRLNAAFSPYLQHHEPPQGDSAGRNQVEFRRHRPESEGGGLFEGNALLNPCANGHARPPLAHKLYFTESIADPHTMGQMSRYFKYWQNPAHWPGGAKPTDFDMQLIDYTELDSTISMGGIGNGLLDKTGQPAIDILDFHGNTLRSELLPTFSPNWMVGYCYLGITAWPNQKAGPDYGKPVPNPFCPDGNFDPLNDIGPDFAKDSFTKNWPLTSWGPELAGKEDIGDVRRGKPVVTVLDGNTGAAVTGATVTVHDYHGWMDMAPQPGEEGALAGVTDASGRVSFDGKSGTGHAPQPPAGPRLITIQAVGYPDHTYPVWVAEKGEFSATDPRPATGKPDFVGAPAGFLEECADALNGINYTSGDDLVCEPLPSDPLNRYNDGVLTIFHD
ncbi:MAG: carboxypeptidase regulatory-like domain-containing protein [Deltaproteobacteria bacterium]|nr:carboxypeptidase regulatory-like domain-containing protein [Deltaproteobacteria bacterium]